MTWNSILAGLPVLAVLLLSVGCIVLAAYLYAERDKHGK